MDKEDIASTIPCRDNEGNPIELDVPKPSVTWDTFHYEFSDKETVRVSCQEYWSPPMNPLNSTTDWLINIRA